MDAIGDRTRRSILSRLSDGPAAVGELAEGMAVGRPAVSQHLKVLKAAGLVSAERDGNRRLYALAPEGIRSLRAYLDSLWDVGLHRFAAEAEAAARTRSRR